MRGVAAALVCLMLLVPFSYAQETSGPAEKLEIYPSPKTQEAEQVQDLFGIVTWIAIAIFVFVEGLLLYVIWRFRNNKSVPKGETHRGHTKAEVAWSVAPALILIFIGALSVQTLETLDKIPEDADFTVGVTASQFSWRFAYPDGNTTGNQLFVESGQTVRLEITSRDVIHAIWVPEFALKIDAVPGRTNYQWFTAPEPGTYFLQCAEYCGRQHHEMRAEIVVFPKGARDVPYGAPPTPGVNPEDIPQDVVVDSELFEWGITPPTLEVTEGQGVHVNVLNTGQADHNFTIPALTPGRSSALLANGERDTYAFIADQVGEFKYICGVPGHESLGMVGTITVRPAEG